MVWTTSSLIENSCKLWHGSEINLFCGRDRSLTLSKMAIVFTSPEKLGGLDVTKSLSCGLLVGEIPYGFGIVTWMTN